MPRRHLTQKRIIITGASAGIGRSLAKRLSAIGCRLLITARRRDRLQILADEIVESGGECQIVAGDIADTSVQQTIVETCLTQFQGIDGLINNAGIGAMGQFSLASPDRLRHIFDVNFFAPVELTRRILPDLIRGDDPLIVNIGSVLGHRATPLKSEYCASKFAIHGFSDALRAELSGTPIEVLLVSPSTTDSDFFASAIEDSTGKSWLHSRAMSPDYVALKTIMAMQKRKHELILPLSGKMLVWLDRLFPTLANHIVARFGN